MVTSKHLWEPAWGTHFLRVFNLTPQKTSVRFHHFQVV